MRAPLALAGMAVLVLSAPAPAQKRDWSAQVAATPGGGHLVGNPAAKTRIVEWASYTCPHCAHFAAEAKAPLAPMLRAGATNIEYRHMIRDPLDLAAVIVARCGGPRRFQKLNAAIYAGQDVWLPRGAEFAQVNRGTLAKAEPGAQLRGLAEGAGLLAIGRANGLTDAALIACFADRAAIDRLVAQSRSVPAEVTGTPSFFVNGRYTGVHDWQRLQPLLVAK
jgi:protein-disulfide isomerase